MQSEATLVEKRHLAGLDLVRFSAAALVMFFHLMFWSWAAPGAPQGVLANSNIAFPDLVDLSWYGAVGVEIFFVLSGYVIMSSAAKSSASQFITGRILRLYPAAFICSTLTLIALFLIGTPNLADRYINSITLWPMGPWIDGVYWTLGIEMAFYAVVAATISFGGTRRLEIVIIAIGAASTAYLAADYFTPQFSLTSASPRIVRLLLLQHGCLFALGAVLWFANNRKWTTVRIIAVAVFLCASLYEAHGLHFEANAAGRPGFLFIPPVVLALAVFAIATSPLWALNGIWASRVRTLGLMTYPLYLVHNVFGLSIMKWTFDAGLSRHECLITAILAVTLISYIVTMYLEPVVRRVSYNSGANTVGTAPAA